MKFKIVELRNIKTKFGSYKEADLLSTCGRYSQTKVSGMKNASIGDIVNTYDTHPVQRLTNRLAKIGIDITSGANIPWIYLTSVNGKEVTERYGARHGFTLGYLESTTLTDLDKIFKTIRTYIKESK